MLDVEASPSSAWRCIKTEFGEKVHCRNEAPIQVSHFNNTARLNVFLSSSRKKLLSQAAHRQEKGRKDEWKKRRVGCFEIGTWRRRRRINHPVRRATPPDWKNSGGLSPSPSLLSEYFFAFSPHCGEIYWKWTGCKHACTLLSFHSHAQNILCVLACLKSCFFFPPRQLSSDRAEPINMLFQNMLNW